MSRLQHADGAVQTFVARQIGIAHLMGYIIAADQPALADEVAAALSDSGVRRDAHSDVLDQAVEMEQLMLRLWRWRIHGEEGLAILPRGVHPWS
jgi:hypothetical protein